MKHCYIHRITLTLLIFLIPVLIFSQDTQELMDMSLDDLLDMEIVSASKKAQKIEDAPAAIYVITQDDIKKYGYMNLGEALRMVPGVEIIQSGNHKYEVSFRGFSRTAFNKSNKVLFLVNGRPVYNEVFGGVRIFSLNVSMNEVKRIEVIRGPGSSLYGANAFSGVVNIITENPTEQEGFKADINYGALGETYSNLTYGSDITEKTAFSFSLGFDQMLQSEERLFVDDELRNPDMSSYDIPLSEQELGYPEGQQTALMAMRAKLNLKYDISEDKSLNIYTGFNTNRTDVYWVIPAQYDVNDFYAQIDYRDEKNFARLYFNGSTNGRYESGRNLSIEEPSNPYLIATNREEIVDHTTRFVNQQLDFEYQRTQDITDNLNLIGGVNYRRNFARSNVYTLDGESTLEGVDIIAGYAQFDWRALDNLTLGLGARADWHTYVGMNINPRLTAIFKPTEKFTLRAGAGTATRNPALFDNLVDGYAKITSWENALNSAANSLPPEQAAFGEVLRNLRHIENLTAQGDFLVLHAIGSEDLDAERLTSIEFGFQYNATEKLQIRTDLFYNIMSDAISFRDSRPDQYITQMENVNGILQAAGVPEEVAAQFTNPMSNQDLLNAAQQFAQAGQLDLAGLMGGLAQLVYDENNNPNPAIAKTYALEYVNEEDEYVFMGGELSFLYVLNQHLSLTANYGYLQFNDEYNQRTYTITQGENAGQKGTLDLLISPEHKANLGIKFNYSGLFGGVMFNYMSERKFQADNNLDGQFTDADLNYSNGGINELEARVNLNINLGYDFGTFEIYAVGMNLIQSDDYRMFEASASIPVPADYLDTRVMGGVRIKL